MVNISFPFTLTLTMSGLYFAWKAYIQIRDEMAYTTKHRFQLNFDESKKDEYPDKYRFEVKADIIATMVCFILASITYLVELYILK